MDDPADTTSGSAGTTWVYEYDRGGNITAKMRYAYTTGTVGALLQTIPYIYNATWKDKLAAYNGQTITSDAIGNTLNDGTWTYYWEMGRRLWQMEKGNYGDPNSVLMNFNYNAEGVRIGKLCDSHDASGNNSYVYTDYYVHGKKIMHMTQSGNNLHFFYDAQGRPAVVNYNGTKYAYILNLQGDVLGLRNSSGTEVVKYTYDAWGKILSTTGSMASSLGKLNPFRYRGYVYDEETGLYYLQSRYYNPEWGRFINADVLIHKPETFCLNAFSYCSNDPLLLSDPSGLFGNGTIHHAVCDHIVLSSKGTLRKTDVKLIFSDFSYGLADIVDENGMIWEVKRATCPIKPSIRQFNKYLTGILIKENQEVTRGDDRIIQGIVTSVPGYIAYYTNVGNGYILYDYIKLPDKKTEIVPESAVEPAKKRVVTRAPQYNSGIQRFDHYFLPAAFAFSLIFMTPKGAVGGGGFTMITMKD